jgi:hemin uptake protein HemP
MAATPPLDEGPTHRLDGAHLEGSMEPVVTTKQQPIPTQSKPRVRATALLQGHREVIIEHGNEEYRLRLTRQGKLLLTK